MRRGEEVGRGPRGRGGLASRALCSDLLRCVRGDPTSERVLLDVRQPAGNHNGGQITFGLDGGSSNDVFNNGRDPTTILGSILRIDVDRREGDLAYAIPYDNPFDGSQGRRRETM